MSLADIHARAERFQSRIRWRNWIEYAAGAIVVFGFGVIALETPDWGIRAAVALLVAGVAFITWKLATVAGAATKAEAQTWATFHRAELVRQQRALSTVWQWYLAPITPGVAAFIVATAFAPMENDIPMAPRLAIVALGGAWVAAVFSGIAWINHKAAKKLAAEIEALDQAREG